MYRIFLYITLLLIVTALNAQSCVLDGQTIPLDFSAKRVITLAPNLTELMYTIGAKGQLIATDTGSDYPIAVKRLPKVASASDLDMEAILKLHPDLVIAWLGGNPEVQLQKLRSFGIKVYAVKIRHLKDIASAMRSMGCLTGHRKLANQKADDFLQTLVQLKKQAATQAKLSVFYDFNAIPLVTLTKRSLLNDMIVLCGGENIFANAVGVAPEVSPESVLVKKPLVMLGTQPGWQKVWQKWRELPAVRMGNLFTINPDFVLRGDYRSLQGVKQICADFQVARKAASM